MLYRFNPKSIWYLDRTRMHGNNVFYRITAQFFRRRSEVETIEGHVRYRRRIFRWFGLRQYTYIDYYFHSVNDIYDNIHQSYWVLGKITAVYLLEDGQTIHHEKDVNHVSLPKTFTNMLDIRNALEALHE